MPSTKWKAFLRDLPSPYGPLLWVLALATVCVAVKNGEDGLSTDAPLYATIARQIVRTGDWLTLDGWVCRS